MLPTKSQLARSLVIFTVVFVSINLPAPKLGRAVAGATSALASACCSADPAKDGLDLRFAAAWPHVPLAELGVNRAWTMAVLAQRPSTGGRALISVNWRKLAWVPLSVFVALALASPIWRTRRGPIVLATGLVTMLVPIGLLTLLNVVGPMYEHYVIELSPLQTYLVRFGYALLAPPGVVYAFPLLLWAMLMVATRPAAPARP